MLLQAQPTGPGAANLASGESDFLTVEVHAVSVDVPAGRAPRSRLHLRIVGPPLAEAVCARRQPTDESGDVSEGQRHNELFTGKVLEESRQRVVLRHVQVSRARGQLEDADLVGPGSQVRLLQA